MKNIPNILSIYRIVASPVLVSLIFLNQRGLFFFIFVISLFTDILDGFFARKFNLESKTGALLDSIGDIATLITGIIGIAIFEQHFVFQHHIPIISIFGFYFFQKCLSIWRYGKISSFHTYTAKMTAHVQGIFFISLFCFGTNLWLFYTVVVMSTLTFIEDSILVCLLPKWQTNVKGLLWVLKEKKV